MHKFGKKGEDIVFKHLKKKHRHVFKHGTKGYLFPFGDFQVGKNENTCKIIEVKGQSTDYNSRTKHDVPRKEITISKTEYNFLKDNPNRFFVYVVYRLIYDRNTEYRKPRIAIVKGTDLLEKKPKVKEVNFSTPNNFWKKTEQFTVR